MKLRFVTAVMAGLLFLGGTAQATDVFVNGKELRPNELLVLERMLGASVVPGYYLYNPRTGCWANLVNGASGCLNAGSGGSPADRWVSPEELTHGGLRGVRPGPLSTYDFVR
ncbi:hypothetical protein [Methylohalobius crimeensis]|uniref:hypothetical protein n=1 Tax=Methylohalobius crimeensis TaxID=244365 RepID=UPI0012696AE3|nr:hypothetical protein [Methylohalobius crimeensis]